MKDIYTCKQWTEKLILSQEEFTKEEYHDLRRHLTLCSSCLTRYEIYHKMAEAVRALPPAGPLPSLLPLLHKLKEVGANDLIQE